MNLELKLQNGDTGIKSSHVVFGVAKCLRMLCKYLVNIACI